MSYGVILYKENKGGIDLKIGNQPADFIPIHIENPENTDWDDVMKRGIELYNEKYGRKTN